MSIQEVVTVSDARSHLSQLLNELAAEGSSATPVLIGAHRKPQGVLLSVQAYEALVGAQQRRSAVASATGSVTAEGLHTSPAADRDTEEYVEGALSGEEMVQRAVGRHSRVERH